MHNECLSTRKAIVTLHLHVLSIRPQNPHPEPRLHRRRRQLYSPGSSATNLQISKIYHSKTIMPQASLERQIWWRRGEHWKPASQLVVAYRNPNASSIGRNMRSFSTTKFEMAQSRKGSAKAKASTRTESRPSSSRWAATPSAGGQSSATASQAAASNPSTLRDQVGINSSSSLRNPGFDARVKAPRVALPSFSNPESASLPSQEFNQSKPRVSIHSLRYKQAARKWTSAMIAMPILVVTSYFLYDRRKQLLFALGYGLSVENANVEWI